MWYLLLLACRNNDGKGVVPTFEDADGAQVAVSATGQVTLKSPQGLSQLFTLSFGFVSSYDEQTNYDPYLLKDPAWVDAIPLGLTWSAAKSASWEEDSYRVSLDNGQSARLVVDDSGPGIRLSWRQEGGEYAPFARLTTEISAGAGYYGLGETFDGVEHTGTVHAMHMVYDETLESSYNEAHVPVPLLISTAGWGVLVDSYRPGVFDVGSEDPGLVDIIFEQVDDFVIDLYAPERPTEVTARYHARTGMPELPPTWAFAPMQWRNVAADASVIRGDAAAIRENNVATGLIWVDNPWQTSYNSMQPDPVAFPDFTDMVGALHDAGFRFMAWTTPYIEEVDPEYGLYEQSGWLVDAPILFNNFGPMIDFTHPDATAAWESRVEGAKSLGIEGWKLDYGEDLQIGIGPARVQFGTHSGETERTLHSQWAEYFHTPYAKPYQEEGFLLGRAGALGTQDTTDCIWPGDLDSDFHYFRENSHVGGLASAIRGGTSLSASGFPFFASDTGGFRHNRPTHEVMIRWTEYAALLPIMQYGGGGSNHNPWDFTVEGDSAFTEETLAMFKRYASLHTRLFPYFYQIATQAAQEGGSVITALGLAFPELDAHSQTDFIVGNDIFVAPIEIADTTEREVTFPPGTWVHWWNGAQYSGIAMVPAPLGEGPLFVRAGALVPMLRESVMTLSPSDGSVDSWADDPGALWVRAVPGTGEGFVLDSGETASWEDGGILLGDGNLYAGWSVEVVGENNASFQLDGVPLSGGGAGCVDCVIEGELGAVVVLNHGGLLTWE